MQGATMFRMVDLFRYVEICLAVVLFSWTFTRLPLAVKLSGEYFRQLSALVSSPLFVFVLCNVIIVTLFVKSGCFSAQKPVADNAETEIYEEIIKHGGDSTEQPSETDPLVETEPLGLVVYQDKQMVFEEKKSPLSGEAETGSDSKVCMRTQSEKLERESSETEKYMKVAQSDENLPEMGSDSKVCRRTQSEKFARESSKKPREKLRRSETEKHMKVAQSDENLAEKEYPKLSDEEFQRTIEDFIAKQSKFHRQESFAIVVSNHS